MRLKSLRKERPTFEIEGAVISGNRIDLSNGDFKLTKRRSDTSFALPASLSLESSSLAIPLSDRTHDMSNRSRQQVPLANAIQPEHLPGYQALEAAYLERGIRIRISPTRTNQPSGRKSATSLQRHTAFASRNPSRTSSVLQYTSANVDQQHDSRPFSALQQSSSNDFEQTHAHNVSYAQSSQLNDESFYHDCLATSIVASEHSNPTPPPPPTNEFTSTTATSFENDPDFLYMSTLLKKSSGDAFRDNIRRRAGLRGTFSIYRNPLTTNAIQPQHRDKSPHTNRTSFTRTSNTFTVLPPPPTQKIDKDIIKHASRIRKMSQSKDLLTKYSATDPNMTTDTSPPRTSTKKSSANSKSSRALSLKPLEFLLSPASRSASLSTHDLSSTKQPTNSRRSRSSVKRSKSAKLSISVDQNPSDSILKDNFTASSTTLPDESLSLMRTSPLDVAPQTNSFDSGYYDHSSSGGDVQSLTSSSIMQNVSSTPSVRLTSSAARRSHSTKKVSFYEEPTAVVVTTATYV